MAMDMAVALKISAGVTGQQAVDQLRTSLDKLDGAAQQVGRGFAVARSAIGAFLALQAVQAVGSFARETINAADRLDEMSERTGIAVQTLSELEFSAKMNGKALEDVQSALSRVAVKATEAATGNKNAALVFDALGISVKNANGSMRTSLEITEDIGDVFTEIKDPTLKAALAVEIFGKQGPTLIPLIEKLQETRKEARDLGGVVGPEFAKHAAEFNDNMDRAAFMAKGFAGSILSDVLPALSDMFKEFRAGIQVFGSFGSAMWNIGTTNPFRTPLEQAKYYSEEVAKLEEKIKSLSRAENAFAREEAKNLEQKLEQLRKLAQYFKIVSGHQEAGAGRGLINPPSVQPDGGTEDRARGVLAQLSKANAGEDEETRKARERERLLQGLEDAVLKLRDGEDALTISRLKGLTASDAQIEKAKDLLAVLKTYQSGKEIQQILQGIIDETNKLTKSEEELLIAKLKSNNAGDAEIEITRRAFRELVRQRELDQKRKDDAKAKEDADRFAQQQDQTRVQMLESLNDQITSLVYGEEALAIARFRSAGAGDEEVRAFKDLLAQLKQVKKAKDDMEEGRSLRESVRTPEERLSDELDRHRALYNAGAISIETYSRAIQKAREDYLNLGKDGGGVMDDLKQAIEGWGRSSADAIADFAFRAKDATESVADSFKKMVASILKDIAKMLIYRNITEPLFKTISGKFLPSGGGGFFNDKGGLEVVGSLGFANGGIMTSAGAVPLNRYASGGIARSPQLALFGEGRMPEAYVPLPDGRSIPVTMEGGGGTSVVVNVNMQTGQEQTEAGDQRGANLGNVIASVVKQELINQRRPGGLLAAA